MISKLDASLLAVLRDLAQARQKQRRHAEECCESDCETCRRLEDAIDELYVRYKDLLAKGETET